MGGHDVQHDQLIVCDFNTTDNTFGYWKAENSQSLFIYAYGLVINNVKLTHPKFELQYLLFTIDAFTY